MQLISLIILSLASLALSAQTPDIERIAPRDVPVGESGGEIIESDDTNIPQGSDRNAILVPALNGLVFTSNPDGNRNNSSGLNFDNINIPNISAFRGRITPYLGQPLSLALLDRINREVVRHYRENNVPVVDAFVPQGQDITEGNVRIVVLVGKLGQVKVEGAEHFSTEHIESQLRLKTSGSLSTQVLQEDVQWLNRNPFRQVNVLLERGDTFGETDVVLQVDDRLPLRVYAGVEDSGTDITGKERWLTGMNWGNAFGLDHQLGYQFTSSFNDGELNSHSLNYFVPFDWRHTLSVYAAHVKSDPPADGNGFDLTGKSWQLGFRYAYPLTKLNNIDHEMRVGFDYKRSNNNLEFGSLNVFNTFTNIFQYSVTYTASRVDTYGVSGLGITLNYSPGGVGDDNSDTAFNASRANASADYFYTRINLNRVTRLPHDYTWSADVEAQLSTHNLLGSEQLGIGGYGTVRGYDEYAGVGDKGFLMRNELRTPAISLLEHVGINSYPDSLQFLAFLDYGVVSSIDKLPGETSTDMLSSGLGLRYTINPTVTFRADYGWQLKKLAPDDDKDSRIHLSLVLGY